ncbi:hypothetical protein EVAR_10601_1 [Eumeta japonica]|uniref:Uncharacterized protein n=1 Tax=Eumeta variegata TaxID=151549 RepID=A0A4C1U2G9_EUMVA|nr:hypothetical protein EVAR_10601_1 [Eumeta japonica]
MVDIAPSDDMKAIEIHSMSTQVELRVKVNMYIESSYTSMSYTVVFFDESHRLSVVSHVPRGVVQKTDPLFWGTITRHSNTDRLKCETRPGSAGARGRRPPPTAAAPKTPEPVYGRARKTLQLFAVNIYRVETDSEQLRLCYMVVPLDGFVFRGFRAVSATCPPRSAAQVKSELGDCLNFA